MKKVYLIRHGRPDFPGGKRMCLGVTDLPIGAEGLAQAREMAAKLPAVTAVFSSPMIRAVQTAQAIGIPVTILEGLRERNAGVWDGLTFEEIRLRYPDLYAARGTDPTLPMPGAEDNGQVVARFHGAMQAAAEQSPGDFAVVAHAGVISAFLQFIGGGWRKPDYTEIISLIWNGREFTIQEDNDHA